MSLANIAQKVHYFFLFLKRQSNFFKKHFLHHKFQRLHNWIQRRSNWDAANGHNRRH